MSGGGTGAGRPVPGQPAAAVFVGVVEGDVIDVQFGRGFTAADLAVVKGVVGRRYDAERRLWVLPYSVHTLSSLQRSFGSRLIVSGTVTGNIDRTTAAAGRAGDHGARQTEAPVTRPSASASVSVPTPQHESAPATAHESVAPDAGYRAEAEHILELLSRTVRTREYSRKTERAYVGWVRRFIRFHEGRVNRPENLNATHAQAFLEHLALSERLAARSRNQAASALSFVFREVLGRDELVDVARARNPTRVPMVLTHREVLHVLEQLRGKFFLMVVLLYSAGLRLEECLQLRVKDIDFELRQILVRDGKGRKDRYVPLARRAAELLRAQFERVKELHDMDRARGSGWAPLPAALDRKDPNAGFEFGWQYIFPASTVNPDPATGKRGRWPLHATAVQRVVKRAVRAAGITKRASCHTFRHSFATEALRGGCDIRTLQHVMGHKDIRTTMIYLHVVEQTGFYVRSPLDRPDDPDGDDGAELTAPWSEAGMHWQLAARQWDNSRPAKPRRLDSHGPIEPRPRTTENRRPDPGG